MTFPTIPTAGASRVLTAVQANTTATRTFPSLTGLTKNAGDLLIAICIAYQTSTGTNAAFSGWTGGFTEFHDSATSTTMAIGCAYKFSTGSETGTFAVTQAATITGHACFILMSIAGAHASTIPEAGGRNSGTTTGANATSFNPTGWDVEDTLWIAVGGNGETATTGSFDGITVAPTNYTDYAQTGITADAVGGVEGAVAFRQLAAASEDVGAFTLDVSSARSGAITIAVRPVADPNATVTPGVIARSFTLPAATPVITGVLVTDDFNRTNSSTVGNDSNGNAWVEVLGAWEIFSNGVRQTDTSTNPGELRCGTVMSQTNHWAEVTLAASSGTGSIGVMVRMDASAFTGLSFEVADGAYKLIEVTAGSPSTVFTGSGHTHAAGEIFATEIIGTTIRFFLNGTQVASTTSSFASSNTRVALHFNDDATGSASPNRWDNFRAGTGAYPGLAVGETDAPAEVATASGIVNDAVAEVIWPAPILMAPMVAP